jgi:hypothetical protein
MARLGYYGAVSQMVGNRLLFFSYRPQVFESEVEIDAACDQAFETAEENPRNYRYWWDSWLVKQENGEA